MKLFVVAAILGVCLADRLDNKYLPPRGNAGAGVGGPSFGGFGAAAKGAGFGGAGAFGAGSYNAGAGGYNAGGAGAYNSGAGSYSGGNAFGTQYSGNAYNAPAQTYNARPQDAGAQILRQNSEVNADSFSYDFETSNNIRAEAHGVATNGVQEQGSFAYKGDDGQEYSITYTADENGYQPRGAHLPTSPPIPEEILKSLEQNARDEAAGIVDDGTYRGEGAGAGAYNSGAGGYNSGAGAYNSGAGSYNSGAGAYNAGAGVGGGAFSGAKSYNAGKSSFGQNSFGAATSRQYLAPNAGGRGSGNFNPQTGYNY